jgi:hypothetical protein
VRPLVGIIFPRSSRSARGSLAPSPPKFCRWVLDLLGYVEGDELTDLYPGTGIMERVQAHAVLPLGSDDTKEVS